MKKRYIKPQVMFENYAFNTAISACGYIISGECEEMVNTSEIPYEDIYVPGIVYILDLSICNSIKGCYHVSANPVADKIAGGS